MLLKVNVFTKDLERLLKTKEVAREVQGLEQAFTANRSMRAGSLLAWYYLMGSNEDPRGTRDWPRSLRYVKQMVENGEKDPELTRGSSHNTFLLFLL